MGEAEIEINPQHGPNTKFVDAIEVPPHLTNNPVATHFLGRTYNLALDLDIAAAPNKNDEIPTNLAHTQQAFQTSLEIFNSFVAKTPNLPLANKILEEEISTAENTLKQLNSEIEISRKTDPDYSRLESESEAIYEQIYALRINTESDTEAESSLIKLEKQLGEISAKIEATGPGRILSHLGIVQSHLQELQNLHEMLNELG